MNTHDIESQSIIIHTNIRVYGGSGKLLPEDFLEYGDGKLPPQDLVDLGQKRICPRELLRKPNAIRRAAERRLLERGTRFLGGFLIPNEHARWAKDLLAEYRHEFYDYMPEFKKLYWYGVLNWAGKFPVYRKAIVNKAPPVENVVARMNFEFTAYRISDEAIQEADENQSETDTPDSTLNNAFKGIYRDVIDECSQHMRDHVKGKMNDESRRINQRTLSPFRTVRDKLASLSFIDYRFKTLVEYIDQILNSLPDGKIEGTDLARVATLHQLLLSPQAIHRLIDVLS